MAFFGTKNTAPYSDRVYVSPKKGSTVSGN